MNESEPPGLLVLAHHEGRSFRSEMDGMIPPQILPPEPEACFRQTHDSKNFSRVREKPDPARFLASVTQAFEPTRITGHRAARSGHLGPSEIRRIR